MERYALTASSIMNGILWLFVQLIHQRMALAGADSMALADGLLNWTLYLTGSMMIVVGISRMVADEFL